MFASAPREGSSRGRRLALCLVSSLGSSRGKYVFRFVVAFLKWGLVGGGDPHVCGLIDQSIRYYHLIK